MKAFKDWLEKDEENFQTKVDILNIKLLMERVRAAKKLFQANLAKNQNILHLETM